MKIISWNIGLVNYVARYCLMCMFKDKENAIDMIYHVIKKENPDIVYFQELYKYDVQTLKRKFLNDFPYIIHSEKNGLAILSKKKMFKIKTSKFNQDCLSHLLDTYNGYQLVYDKEKDIYFLNVHLSCGLFIDDEINAIKALTDTLNKKIIVGGDFNIYRTKIKTKLNKYFYFDENKDNFKNSSFENILLSCNLDYLFEINHDECKELHTKIINTFESDHYPISAIF